MSHIGQNSFDAVLQENGTVHFKRVIVRIAIALELNNCVCSILSWPMIMTSKNIVELLNDVQSVQ